MSFADEAHEPAPEGAVFITGGSGRIGTALRQRLTPLGYAIRHTDLHPPADGDVSGFVRTDLADQDAMAQAMTGCRALVHLAGHPRDTDWPTLEGRNLTGCYNAFMAARRAGVRTIIYASSNQLCGLHPADAILSPGLEPRPVGLYGVSKVFGEALLRAEAEPSGLIAFAWRICAFKPAPINARDLRLWLSHDDAARLVDRALRWAEPGYRMVWGVSANSRLAIDDPVARSIGYRPRDNAEEYLADLAAAGVDTDRVSEWPWLGGEKAADWMAQGEAAS